MKHPDTGEWINSVVYIDGMGNEYTRSRQNFDENFEKVWTKKKTL